MRRRTFALAAALLAAAAAPAAEPPPGPDTPVAVVDGDTITLGRVDAALKRMWGPTLGPLAPAQVRQFRELLAADMVDELLLRRFLRTHGPAIDPADLDRHLKALGETLAKQGKTSADALRENGQTEAELRETWTTLLQLSRYVRERATDEQLRQYHATNRDHFDRVEVRVSHVVVRAGTDATPVERERARRKLLAVRADVAAGRLSFADAARKHSQCASAPQGGDLGFLTRRGAPVDEALCRAAFALKVGELSVVVETDAGFHVIQVTDRKSGAPTTFEGCAEEVREAFTDDFRAELVANLRKQTPVRVTVPR